MKTVLRVVLILSLVANLAGGYLLLQKRQEAGRTHAKLQAILRSAAAERPADASATDQVLAESDLVGATMGGKKPDPRLRDPWFLKAKLESEGYPSPVVDSVVWFVIYENIGLNDAETARSERWQALSRKLNLRGRIDIEKVQREDPQYQELDAIVKQLSDRLYADSVAVIGIPSPGWKPDAVNPREVVRYGDLPRETMSAIYEVERGSSAQVGQVGERLHNGELQDKTDQERMAALKPILTPAQYEEYLRFNTKLAATIQETIKPIDVDEATYNALWEAAVKQSGSPALGMADFTAEERDRGGRNFGSALAARNQSRESVESYRRVLGDEQFVRIIGNLDSFAASADVIYQEAGLPPAARADLFMEALQALAPIIGTKDGVGIPERKSQLRQSLVQKAGLTADQIAAFDRAKLGSLLRSGNLGGRN